MADDFKFKEPEDGDVSDTCLKDEHENCNMENCMCSCHEEG